MKTDHVVIEHSHIDGKGVFAARDFEKGEVVQRWDMSHELSEDDFYRLSSDEKRYVSCVDKKYIVMQEPERYTNHSCDANTIVINFCDVAVRDIKKGEEITADYTREAFTLEGIVCKCDNVHCKKVI